MLNKLKRLIDGDDKLKLAANQMFKGNTVGDASAIAAAVASATQIGSAIIGNSHLVNSAVYGDKIATSAISALHVGASAVILTKLAYAVHRISFIESGGLSINTSITVASGAILFGAFQLVSTVGSPGAASVMVVCRTDQLANGRLIVSILGTYTNQTAIFEGVIINPA